MLRYRSLAALGSAALLATALATSAGAASDSQKASSSQDKQHGVVAQGKPSKAPAAKSSKSKSSATGKKAVKKAPSARASSASKRAEAGPGRNASKPAQSQGASATNPAGATEADAAGRRLVVGGPTQDELRAGVDDPELRALHDAERVLFPRPVGGLQSGWSWDLPEKSETQKPELSASGLPATGSVAPLASATLSAANDAEWLGLLTLPNLHVKLDERVVKYLKFYRDDPRGRAIVRTWAQKVGRYTPALKATFARFSLPTDLVYLSLIESGHSPTIVSPAGAAGLWQFIPESARLYGLTVDRWVDERLDPERATEAAAHYLGDLKQRFGSWELAMAAYNMGHVGLLRVMRQYNTNDFWHLSQYESALPWETTLYVPKIQAIAIAMNNRKAFGADDVVVDAPVTFDTVYVEPGITLQKVAQAANVPLETITALNPQYLSGRTPPFNPTSGQRRWPIHVPAGNGTLVVQDLATLRPGAAAYTSTLVRLGDTLETIAHRYDTNEAVLQRLNQMRAGESVESGSALLVPTRASGQDLIADQEDYVVVPHQSFMYHGRDRVFYRVRAGDTVSAVANAFSVSVTELSGWNSLDENANLQPDMTLQLYVPEGADLSRVRCVRPEQTLILETGTPQFIEFFEAQKGRRRVTIAAQDGDTLARIGGRYGMTASMMERINRFGRDKKLKLGEQIIVYTNRMVPPREQPPAAQAALPPVITTPTEERASIEHRPETHD